MGAVDGPGLRCVVFMQGCDLRCIYCHNPETWDRAGGKEICVEELVSKIDRYRNYIQKDGGVTVSGGEALMQWQFVAELFRKLKVMGYHTALDTSGVGDLQGAKAVLQYTDLVIADMKFPKASDFRRYCHGDIQEVFDFLALTAKMGIPLWIRQVIVPGINDTKENILALVETVSCYPNLVKVELLPFRKLCESKYKELGIPFLLKDTPECSGETIAALEKELSIALKK
ncbi:Pyruvate formate-lyase 1-activating enzyme [bioreactor metagenome]|uniref:Pyruvate formate-lyase 1-activating enzyme n=1 Tax=bioreactor metagenome TaxID=1076179 RepID=A0A644Y958_9ZZZZ